MAIAKPAISATTVVAPRVPKRSAAQPTSGKNTNAMGTSRVANTPHNPNISCDPANRVTSNAIASPMRDHVQSVDRP